jgi:PilX N-terminal
MKTKEAGELQVDFEVLEARRVMNEQALDPLPRGHKESGFALILAILALMLLTFLGLTLAATTSTELQIATNYRWSQQALYNAEAGIEAGKLILSRLANPTTGWLGNLPAIRPGNWIEGAAPDPPAGTGRDYAPGVNCANDRGGVGYGVVITEAGTRYEAVSNFMTVNLNGAFTLWIRRDVTVDNSGKYADATDNSSLILTAEGVAPYISATNTFMRANQAVRVLEVRFNLETTNAGEPCLQYSGQQGQGPGGDNFNPCAVLKGGAGGSLEASYGAANVGGTGSLGSIAGVQ